MRREEQGALSLTRANSGIPTSHVACSLHTTLFDSIYFLIFEFRYTFFSAHFFLTVNFFWGGDVVTLLRSFLRVSR